MRSWLGPPRAAFLIHEASRVSAALCWSGRDTPGDMRPRMAEGVQSRAKFPKSSGVQDGLGMGSERKVFLPVQSK